MGARPPIGRRQVPLVDGLTIDERVSRLETAVRGNAHRRGLADDYEALLTRVQDLESAERRRTMGWFARLMLRWGGRDGANRDGAAAATPRGPHSRG